MGAVKYGNDSFIFVNINNNPESLKIPAKCEVPIDCRKTLRFGKKETADSVYLSLSQFGNVSNNSIYKKGTDRQYEEFFKSARKFQNKKNIILDLRSNRGGELSYPNFFLAGLYFKAEDIENDEDSYYSYFHDKIGSVSDSIVIWSPEIFNVSYEYVKNNRDKKSLKYARLFRNKALEDSHKYEVKGLFSFKEEKNNKNGNDNIVLPDEPVFQGNLYIITDRNTASASEMFIAIAKSVFKDKVIVVGENTCGCISYGGIMWYRLPATGLMVQTSRTKYTCLEKIDSWKGEGFGFYPDVWSSGEDLLETLVTLTGDEDLRSQIPYIERALQ